MDLEHSAYRQAVHMDPQAPEDMDLKIALDVAATELYKGGKYVLAAEGLEKTMTHLTLPKYMK